VLSIFIVIIILNGGVLFRYKVIREMELTFLFDHWEELKSSQRLRDIVKAVTRGTMPHASEALESILAH
jgi:hypothetical protein